MKTNSVLLTGTAAAALLCSVTLATPVFAQRVVTGPQYSTPAEHAQTEQLNDQSIDGTTESPAQLNGEDQTQPDCQYNTSQDCQDNDEDNQQGYSGYQQQNPNGQYPVNPYTDQNAQPSTAPGYQGQDNEQYNDRNGPPPNAQDSNDYNDTYQNGMTGQDNDEDSQSGYSGYQQQNPNDNQQQYDQQMQQYQDQQQQYQDQRDQYDNQNDRYHRDLSRYDVDRWNFDYPASYPYEYGGARLERMDMVAEPQEELHGIPIEGPGGRWVGRIRNIDTSVNGGAQRVEIALNRRVSVWVNAWNLRFDPSEHVAYTNLTRQDLWQMPGATLESGPM